MAKADPAAGLKVLIEEAQALADTEADGPIKSGILDRVRKLKSDLDAYRQSRRPPYAGRAKRRHANQDGLMRKDND